MQTHISPVPQHIIATIADLKFTRDQVTSAISVLEAMFGGGEQPAELLEAEKAVRPKKRKLGSRPAKRARVAAPEASEAEQPAEANRLSNRDLIRSVIGENKKRNAVEVCDRVLELRPGLDRGAVSTAISQLIAAKEARKLDDLTVIPFNLKLPVAANGAANGARG
jgi:hypothetical protein